MGSAVGNLRFQAAPHALVRTVHHPRVSVPPWPDLVDTTPAGVRAWREWMRATWSNPALTDAIRHASPALARELDALSAGHTLPRSRAQKALVALAGYCLRASHRPMPFGLFAGVAEARFGPRAEVAWGEDHRATARAGGDWMADIIVQLEGMPEVRRRLLVQLNNIAQLRGDRLIVPWQVRCDGSTSAVEEVSVRHTAQVWAVAEMTTTPMRYEDVVGKLRSEFPAFSDKAARAVLNQLLSGRVLLSNLTARSTEIDTLGYLLDQLVRTGVDHEPQAADLVAALREIHQLMREHNQLPVSDGAPLRASLVNRMAERSPAPEALAVDMLIDGTVTLPRAVGWEAEGAATALARINPEPYGNQPWRDYRERFLQRYGPGALVPLTELLDPTSGLGLPTGFRSGAPVAHPPLSRRDDVLLARAQQAAGTEIDLDEDLIAELAVGEPSRMQLPPGLELRFEVRSASTADLDAGRFELADCRLGREWGHLSGGRFAAQLAARKSSSPSGLLGQLSTRPTSIAGALPAQLAFPALRHSATHVARVPQLVAPRISLSEHHAPTPDSIHLADLAVMCDGDRLHLVSRSRQQIVEPFTAHPLQIEYQTPWTVRFLAELTRGQLAQLDPPPAQINPFPWGAARRLPILPRVRHQRTVLSPATWRLNPTDLPGPDVSTAQWEDNFHALRERWQLPHTVAFEYLDQRLRLNLDNPGHLALLRAQVERPRRFRLFLTETAAEQDFGWCEGRPHEVVTLLRPSTAPPPPPAVPRSTTTSIDSRLPDLPGASPYLHARLYCPTLRRADLLRDHLPTLIDRLQPSTWWYRADDDTSGTHLDVYVRQPADLAPGDAMGVVSSWAQRLLESGVIGDMALTPYRPHTGRWGNGALLTAAEDVFAADSTVTAQQITSLRGIDDRIVTAAGLVEISAAWHNSPEHGLRWLQNHTKHHSSVRLPRPLQKEAVRMANPHDRSPLLSHHGSGPLSGPLKARHKALSAYRELITAQAAIDPDTALAALLHEHCLRAPNPAEEYAALHLARAAALAHTARRSTPSRHQPTSASARTATSKDLP
ncbi:lantibiotic dehydratase [Streptomyces sp. G7(2002)]|uniref:lantibiotic dehydratase n=1 Tax=Streptomyces sp. G7(2002) TaxID=2971798 RepID=UPI00237DC8EE|nr:lantibiotic dehydratase [Streptomyces sp. G7(2002)]WDT53517.1 lantibiotic dehydratase [Streptomyces sp. G7(2002)]